MDGTLESWSPEQTSQWAAVLARQLAPGDCLVLSGDLGAGKTWFASSLLAELKIRETAHSPTFNLVNVYTTESGLTIYHADFYRLDSPAELWAAGWEDYLDGQGLLIIEWGERFPQALPDDYLQISLQVTGPFKRRLVAEAQGIRGQAIKEGWADALVSS